MDSVNVPTYVRAPYRCTSRKNYGYGLTNVSLAERPDGERIGSLSQFDSASQPAASWPVDRKGPAGAFPEPGRPAGLRNSSRQANHCVARAVFYHSPSLPLAA